MDDRPLKFVSVLAILILASAMAEAGEIKDEAARPADGEILVHLKGMLLVGTRLKPDADPKSRVQDDGAWELDSARIRAGGAQVSLDWSRSDEIRDELLWWRLPRHGDVRSVQADVTGTLTFRPSPAGQRSGTKNAAGDALEPVVVVESIHVQLVGPDGKPSGPQFGRRRVTVR